MILAKGTTREKGRKEKKNTNMPTKEKNANIQGKRYTEVYIQVHYYRRDMTAHYVSIYLCVFLVSYAQNKQYIAKNFDIFVLFLVLLFVVPFCDLFNANSTKCYTYSNLTEVHNELTSSLFTNFTIMLPHRPLAPAL